ncbi:inner membrane protein YjcH [mine drainage metagenome]|uniref:Inner membrane protein YjcH n=1 Tax=mine drainage metagenome TaxID=410659 RepID=A0A1J5R0Q5_9ZZZZ
MIDGLPRRIGRNPKYAELVRRRARFAWGLAALVAAAYLAFIGLAAWAPALLARPLLPGGSLSLGLGLGVGVILWSVALTGIYVRRANAVFDPLIHALIEESR